MAVVAPAGGVFYVLTDPLATPRQIVDSQKRLRWRWDHADPFGANLPNANPQALGAFPYNLRLPGQVYDAETGLHYNNARDYDPKIGRYIQPDPIGLLGGVNPYAYVGNNPLGAIDPLGLDFLLVGRGQHFVVTGTLQAGDNVIGGPLDPLDLANCGLEIGASLGAGELAVAKFLAKQGKFVANFARTQLDKKFKHASDFGVVTTKKNPETIAQFESAIRAHLEDAGTVQKGTYGFVEDSRVFFNPNTNNAVVLDESGILLLALSLRRELRNLRISCKTAYCDEYYDAGILEIICRGPIVGG